MVRRGPGGGAGVGTPPHTIPCQHHVSMCSAAPLDAKKLRIAKKHVDSMLIPCYDVDERRTLTKRKETRRQ